MDYRNSRSSPVIRPSSVPQSEPCGRVSNCYLHPRFWLRQHSNGVQRFPKPVSRTTHEDCCIETTPHRRCWPIGSCLSPRWLLPLGKPPALQRAARTNLFRERFRTCSSIPDQLRTGVECKKHLNFRKGKCEPKYLEKAWLGIPTTGRMLRESGACSRNRK